MEGLFLWRHETLNLSFHFMEKLILSFKHNQIYRATCPSHMFFIELRFVQSLTSLILQGGNEGDCLHAPGHCLGALEMIQ